MLCSHRHERSFGNQSRLSVQVALSFEEAAIEVLEWLDDASFEWDIYIDHDGKWFHVYCFSEPADARKFMERFGGEKFDPSERGRGANWAQWRKR